jgi:hypothetical protein
LNQKLVLPAVAPPAPAPAVSLTGVWLGQDGHDVVGPSSVPAPDGSQDTHIKLSGLFTNRTVTAVDVEALGGGQWLYNGPYGPWAAAFVRSPGATTADIYIQPSQVETGRPYSVVITYDDGSKAGAWVTGGKANPTLHMPAITPSAVSGKAPATTANAAKSAAKLAKHAAPITHQSPRKPVVKKPAIKTPRK